MSMDYIRETYNVPCKRGQLVEVFHDNGRLAFRGRVASASNYLHVKSERGGHSLPFHPTNNVVYYADDDKTILADTRTPQIEQHRARERKCLGSPVGWEAKRKQDERWTAVGAGSSSGRAAAREFAGEGGLVRPVYAGAPEPATDSTC